MHSPLKRFTAVLAAISLNACQQSSPPPVISPKVEPVVRVVEVSTAVEPPKAVVPFDILAVAHEAPNVDHLAHARQLSSEGDVKGALLEARRALFSTPADVETLTTVAKLSRRNGQHDLASEAWARIAVLTPDDAMPLIQHARTLMQLKNFEEAVQSARQAIERDPENAEPFQVMGKALLSLNNLSEAIASFERAVEINPEHGWALNNLGFAYLRANQNEQAVSVLERAVQVLPTAASVHNNFGVALERTGRNDEAKAAYQESMDLSPKYVKARLNAARVAKVQVPQLDELMNELHAMPEESP